MQTSSRTQARSGGFFVRGHRILQSEKRFHFSRNGMSRLLQLSREKSNQQSSGLVGITPGVPIRSILTASYSSHRLCQANAQHISDNPSNFFCPICAADRPKIPNPYHPTPSHPTGRPGCWSAAIVIRTVARCNRHDWGRETVQEMRFSNELAHFMQADGKQRRLDVDRVLGGPNPPIPPIPQIRKSSRKRNVPLCR